MDGCLCLNEDRYPSLWDHAEPIEFPDVWTFGKAWDDEPNNFVWGYFKLDDNGNWFRKNKRGSWINFTPGLPPATIEGE